MGQHKGHPMAAAATAPRDPARAKARFGDEMARLTLSSAELSPGSTAKAPQGKVTVRFRDDEGDLCRLRDSDASARRFGCALGVTQGSSAGARARPSRRMVRRSRS